MTRNTITDGPSMWDLNLAMFDRTPATTGAPRTVGFKLKCGSNIRTLLHGVQQPDFFCPSGGDDRTHWTLTGDTAYLPDGYDSISRTLVVRYNPYKRAGYVDLEMTCTECKKPILPPKSIQADAQAYACPHCEVQIMVSESGSSAWKWSARGIVARHDEWGGSIDVLFLNDKAAAA